jgi:hypothetical protein
VDAQVIVDAELINCIDQKVTKPVSIKERQRYRAQHRHYERSSSARNGLGWPVTPRVLAFAIGAGERLDRGKGPLENIFADLLLCRRRSQSVTSSAQAISKRN